MHLAPSEYIPWFGSVLAEIALLAILLKRRFVLRFPFFFASIAYDVARQAVFFITLAEFKQAYYAAYWLSIPVEYTLAFAVIYEAFRYAFKADIRFSPGTLRVFVAATVLLVLVAATCVLRPGVQIKNLEILILVLDRSSQLLRCGLLVFLWVYSSRLGISWRHHVWGIVFGLAMYSGVGLVVATVNTALGQMCGPRLATIQQFAYLAATIIWPIYFLRNEPERGPLTLEDLHSFADLIALGERAVYEIRKVMRDQL